MATFWLAALVLSVSEPLEPPENAKLWLSVPSLSHWAISTAGFSLKVQLLAERSSPKGEPPLQ